MDDVDEDLDAGVPRRLRDVNHKDDAVMEKHTSTVNHSHSEDSPVGDDPVVRPPPMEAEFKGMEYLHSLQRRN